MATASLSASPTPQPELCVSIKRFQASIKRGHAAGYIIRVWTRNASVSYVSITLKTLPTSQKATFTSGCTKGDGTASCIIKSVTTRRPAVLHAQIAVSKGATSVKSVKLTATARILTTQKWKPPSAAQTTPVTQAASPRPSLGTPPLVTVPLGPIPDLNGAASTFIAAGNAANLFPVIKPSATPSPTVTALPSPATVTPSARPTPEPRAFSTTRLVPRTLVACLFALSLTILLTVAWLYARKRKAEREPPT
jgi:hypothetical protein